MRCDLLVDIPKDTTKQFNSSSPLSPALTFLSATFLGPAREVVMETKEQKKERLVITTAEA
jgi:hypothetical protein